EGSIACDVAARMRKALHQPGAQDIAHSDHYDGNRRGRCLGRNARRRPVGCDYVHQAPDEIGRGLGEPLGRAVGTAIFKRNVLAFQIAEIVQALPESIPHRRIIDDADARNPSLLLRARRDRPTSRRAAEQSDELAPFHSITSSASSWIEFGTLRPSALAVLRLMTN